MPHKPPRYKHWKISWYDINGKQKVITTKFTIKADAVALENEKNEQVTLEKLQRKLAKNKNLHPVFENQQNEITANDATNIESGLGFYEFARLSLHFKGTTKKGGWTDSEFDIIFDATCGDGDKKARLALDHKDSDLRRNHIKPKFKYKVLKSFLVNLGAAFKFFGKEIDAFSITFDSITDFVNNERESVGKSSVNAKINAISNVYRYGLKLKQFRGLPLKNPVDRDFHHQGMTEPRMRYWYDDERSSFRKGCHSLGEKILFSENVQTLEWIGVVPWNIGTRIFELLSLQVSQVKIFEGLIELEGVITKNGKRRIVTIDENPEVVKILKELIKGKKPSDYVFQWKASRKLANGGQVNYRSILRLFNMVCELVGIHNAGFHDWRKTAAINWRVDGNGTGEILETEEIKSRLQHKEIETTLGYIDEGLVKKLRQGKAEKKAKKWKEQSHKNAA